MSVDHVGYPVSHAQVYPNGLICIKDVGLQGGVNSIAEMQILPTGLLSYEASMVFIVDLGPSRMSTSEQSNFVCSWNAQIVL